VGEEVIRRHADSARRGGDSGGVARVGGGGCGGGILPACIGAHRNEETDRAETAQPGLGRRIERVS